MEFLEEHEENRDLARCFSNISAVKNKGIGMEVAYVLGEGDEGGEEGGGRC